MGKKVVFIITGLNAGGIETYLLRYLNYDISLNAIVICKSGIGGQLENEYQKRLGHNNIIKLKVGFFNVVSWFKLYRLFKQLNVDTVCDFTGNFAGIPMQCAKITGIKKRISFYRGSSNHFKEDFFRLFYNKWVQFLVLKNSTKILSNSYAALDYFFPERSFESEKFKVVYNGIDENFINTEFDKNKIREELEIPQDAFVVGHTGRYTWAKNHKTIIKVAISLCVSCKNIYFLIIGKGTKEALLSQIEKLGLQKQIKILGYRSDIGNLLSAMDLFFFPSITEGQPNSLLEAMVRGLPIIASNINPIRESVPPNFRKELLDPLDVDAAIKKIKDAYYDSTILDSMIFTQWARNRYNAKTAFEAFHRELC